MKFVLRVLKLEPVSLGAALGAWIMAARWDSLIESAAILTIAWVVRSLSTPTSKVEQQKQEAQQLGYEKAKADIASLASLSKSAIDKLSKQLG